MKIEVHLHTTLGKQNQEGRDRVLIIDLPEKRSIQDILNNLNIDQDPDHLLFVLNGETVGMDQELGDGDVLDLITAISGG